MILNSRGNRLCERKCPAFREGSTGLCWCDVKMLYHGWDKPEYDDLLRGEFSHKFGVGTTVVLEHVEEIPREASGKFMLVKNHVDK